MNIRLLAWITLPIVGLILAGYIAWQIVTWLFGWIFYLAVGVAAVGVVVWGFSKARNKVTGGGQRHSLPPR